jgi:hypothetical protein
MDMDIDADPVGIDPLTGNKIYWGEGHEVSCDLVKEEEDIPF